jgi:hypothetical protein
MQGLKTPPKPKSPASPGSVSTVKQVGIELVAHTGFEPVLPA